MTPKFKDNQSAPGLYGHGDGGHSHDWPGEEGEDGVFPPLAILLLPGGTSLWRGPLWDQSLKTEILSCKNSLSVYRAGRKSLCTWLILFI